MASDSQVYTFEEVLKHTKLNDCWVIISGKVYDVSQFMEEHPGGDDVLIASTGKDASDDFENTGHSDSAKEMMKNYIIGDVDTSTIVPLRRNITREVAPPSQAKDSDFYITLLQFLAPLFILGLALGVLQYTK